MDAYTVKKVLPRLLAAVILIQLSWYIFTAMIQIVNVVGWGLEGLMYAPFGGRVEFEIPSLLEKALPDGGGTTLFATAAVIGGGAALGLFGLFSLAITAVFALLVGFFTLVLREVVIIVLLVLSPLALAAWILPNTEKFWKMWWDSWSKLLLMYPLILLLLAGGKFVAYITASSPGITGGGALQIVIVVLAIFLPFFLIPRTFQMAGAAFASVSGAVRSASKPGFDRLKGYRGKKAQENWQNVKSGQRFSGTNALSSSLNRNLQRAAHVNKIGLRGLVSPSTARARLATATSGASLAAMQEGLEKDAAFAQVKNDDDLLSAGIRGGSEADVRRFLAARGRQTGRTFDDQDVASVMAARHSLGNNFNAAALVAKAGTGTGYSGRSGSGELTQDIINASRGDRNMENSLFALSKTSAANGRRYDMQAGFGEFLQHKENLRNGGNVRDVSDALTDSALDSQGAGAVLAGRGQSAENFVPALQRRIQGSWNDLQAAYITGNPAAIDQAQQRFTQDVASTEALIDVAGQSSPENARALADGVHSFDLDLAASPSAMRDWLAVQPGGTRTASATMTAREMMDHMGARSQDASIPNAQEYDEMRRNYASSYQSQLAQRQNTAGGPATTIQPTPGTSIT